VRGARAKIGSVAASSVRELTVETMPRM